MRTYTNSSHLVVLLLASLLSCFPRSYGFLHGRKSYLQHLPLRTIHLDGKTSGVEGTEGISRRDVIRGAALLFLAAGEGVPFFTALKNKSEGKASAAVISQIEGTYSDPQHPRGYRILRRDMTAPGIVRVELQDEPQIPPVALKATLTQKSGASVLLFDFSIKGGPRDIAGTFRSVEGQIDFPDGNTWKKITKWEQ